MKKIIFKIQFLILVYILNINSSQELVNNIEMPSKELIDDIYSRSNEGGSKLIKYIKNASILINLSLIALNIKNVKDLIKKNKEDQNKDLNENSNINEKVGFLNKIKNYFKSNKTQLLTVVGTIIWSLIYFRTVHPLFKNRQKIFNLNNKLKDSNFLIYGNEDNNKDKNNGFFEDLNTDFILIPGTKYKNPLDFIKHSFGFSSNYCNGHECYKNSNNDAKNIDKLKLIEKNKNKILFNWNRNLCINDRKDAGEFLSNYMKNNILKNDKDKLIIEGISYGNEVAFEALNNLMKNKENKENFMKKKSTFLMAVPPTNERYLNVLGDFLNLNPENKIITLNNFNEETLLIDFSNRKNLFDFGKAQSDLTIFKNKKFYKDNQDRILGLMSVDKNSDNKEITHHQLAEFSGKNSNELFNFINKKIQNKEIQFGKNYFLSNFYE